MQSAGPQTAADLNPQLTHTSLLIGTISSAGIRGLWVCLINCTDRAVGFRRINSPSRRHLPGRHFPTNRNVQVGLVDFRFHMDLVAFATLRVRASNTFVIGRYWLTIARCYGWLRTSFAFLFHFQRACML